MKRAAIIIHSDNANRIMFWVLGKPCRLGSINLRLDGEVYEIIIFEVPYVKEDKYKVKQRAIIDKFIKEENIEHVLYDDEVDQRLNRIWSTVKIIRILEEIGFIMGECFLNQNFGIISKKIDPILLEALSKEASSIMVLSEEENISLKEELHNKIITETGLSIAFISDSKYLMEQSRIIILDGLDMAEKYKHMVSHPPLNVKEILILPNTNDNYDTNPLEINYAEEIGKLIIKVISAKNIREITCYFPNMHFLKENGNLTNINKSNKILTIQRC